MSRPLLLLLLILLAGSTQPHARHTTGADRPRQAHLAWPGLAWPGRTPLDSITDTNNHQHHHPRRAANFRKFAEANATSSRDYSSRRSPANGASCLCSCDVGGRPFPAAQQPRRRCQVSLAARTGWRTFVAYATQRRPFHVPANTTTTTTDQKEPTQAIKVNRLMDGPAGRKCTCDSRRRNNSGLPKKIEYNISPNTTTTTMATTTRKTPDGRS